MCNSQAAVRDCFGTRTSSGFRLSCEHRTELTCLQDLLKRLQDRHVEFAQVVVKKAVVDAQTVESRYTKCDARYDVSRAGQNLRKNLKQGYPRVGEGKGCH